MNFDLSFFVDKAINHLEKRIQELYISDDSERRPLMYYWVKVANCSNPSCGAEIPLLKQFYLCNKPNKKIYLNPIINGKQIDFEIREGEMLSVGWVRNRKNLICPICDNPTTNKELKKQFLDKKVKDKLLAVVEESKNGKTYRLPRKEETNQEFKELVIEDYPSEILPLKYTKAFDLCTWGYEKYGDLFSRRQLYVLNELVKIINELKIEINNAFSKDYGQGLNTYLSIWFNRMSSRMTQFSIIDLGGEKVVDLFGKQAIQMVFDYPEINILKLKQLSWISRYIASESSNFNSCKVFNSSSGDKKQFHTKYFDAVITDPPYYDAIGYADLSDFYYSWLKRTSIQDYPLIFNTPQTPKSEECTALKHHHNNDSHQAMVHFENKLLEIFEAIEFQTKNIVSVMFAHQSTEAWATLCNSILGAKMNITGSWAINTEKKGGLKENKAFLSSSVTVACRPIIRKGVGDYKQVRDSISKTVSKEVVELYRLGFRGADLLTACFGQAVSQFGMYTKVEKADGREVMVTELLEMAKGAAFNAIVSDIHTDDFTRFYIGWLNLFGFTEAEHDDVIRITQIGLSIDTTELQSHNILIRNGSKETLAEYNYRIEANTKLGLKVSDKEIDKAHRMMFLFKSPNRSLLIKYIAKMAPANESSLWRILNSLSEILPAGTDDHKQATGLLAIKESLIRDAKNAKLADVTQSELDF